nr:aminotransferase class I/II-fold pyridoxal phosphate-dependent enzyme [Paenibacillus sp. OV219]
MAEQTLLEAFNAAPYPVTGNSKWNVNQLLEAFQSVDGERDSDVYGTGRIIEEFQAKIAAYLGKPSAVFFPSGTMAQQIALRIWSDGAGNKKVAYHPLCHLEIHEQNGIRELHQLEPVLLADKSRTIGLADIQQLEEKVSCILLELPQREIGGTLLPFSELESISAYCRERGIKLHLDGARLFEVLPYYKRTAAEICQLFDSVYVSFYKGIGGIAGAILAGDESFTTESKIWKRRHGGDLISLYPYIISSDYYFEQRLPKMEQYYLAAVELAELYNNCQHIETKPQVPVSNMFHVHAAVPKEKLEQMFKAIYAETGVGLTRYIREVDESNSYYEVSLGDRYLNLPKGKVREALELLDMRLAELKQ